MIQKRQQEEAEMVAVFVYGTLMRGERFHEEYLRGARRLGKALAKGFHLYDLGHYPAMVRAEDGSVRGEVYAVTPQMLSSIDQLEGEGWIYKRYLQPVLLDSGTWIQAFCYIYQQRVEAEDRIPEEHQPWSSFSIYKRIPRKKAEACFGVVL